MPLHCATFVSLCIVSFLDCTSHKRHHKLHLSAKIDNIRPILIELWPGNAIEALEKQRHSFHYCRQRRGARWPSWYVLFLHRVPARLTHSWHANMLDQTRGMAHVGNISAKTGHVAKICQQCRVSPTCPQHLQLRSLLPELLEILSPSEE